MGAPPLPPYWSDYLWIVVCGGLASCFMAWGIGANDVANAFATSVGSKTLKLWQAMIIAGIFEFTGAIALGAEVTKTIASDISNVVMFQDAPEIYMYGMLCSLGIAGLWIWVATFWRLPVSTTHSIIGAIMGFSLVFGGVNGVLWNQKKGDFPYTKGFLPVVLSWFFSPLIGGILGAIIFSTNRVAILRRKNSTMLAIYSLPVLLFFTFFINIMFVLAKGAQKEMQKTWPCHTAYGKWGLAYSDCSDLNAAAAWIAACVALGIAVFGGGVGIYFMRRRFLSSGSGGEETDIETVDNPKLQVDLASNPSTLEISPSQAKIPEDPNKMDGVDIPLPGVDVDKHSDDVQPDLQYPKIPSLRPDSLKKIGVLLLAYIRWPFIAFYVQCRRGLFYDIFAHVDLHVDTQALHANAEVFSPKTESVYQVLQVFSACCVSFAHGSNDIANAAGPFSAIYYTYQHYTVPGSTTTTPEWIFVMIGLGLVLGLVMYGYNIILELGVNMLKLTPSRGFSAELAAGLTIVLASFFGIPVSTTQIIVGCEVGVGLCEGSAGISWFTFLRTFMGWILTIILALAFCACLFSMGAYAPSIIMLNDVKAYRLMLQTAASQTLSTLAPVNKAYINDTWWNQSMAGTAMPYNGSILNSTIVSQNSTLTGLKKKNNMYNGYISPQQMQYYYNQSLALSNQYKVNTVGQNITALVTSNLWHLPPNASAALAAKNLSALTPPPNSP